MYREILQREKEILEAREAFLEKIKKNFEKMKRNRLGCLEKAQVEAWFNDNDGA